LKHFDSLVVHDTKLGELHFPPGDEVMAPFIGTNGVWDANEFKWLEENVKPGDNCLNIGANVGYFSILMSRLVGPEGNVKAFEPNKLLFKYFKRNCQNQKTRNVEFYPYAIGDKNGHALFYENKKNFGDGRIFNPMMTQVGGSSEMAGFDLKLKPKKVRIRKLDDLKINKINVVLIDTQGSDHLVIKGMENIIKESRPKILTEFVPGWIVDQGGNPLKVLEEYKSYGYNLKLIDYPEKDNNTSEEIIETIFNSDSFFTNIALTPKI